MNARDIMWSFIDRLCPAVAGAPKGSAVEDYIPPDERRSAKLEAGARKLGDALASYREYPRVTIWKAGLVATQGELVQLSIYPSRVVRIMYRHFREGRYSATFYWADGAWASVCFPDAAAMNDMLYGTAARLLRWPEPEVI